MKKKTVKERIAEWLNAPATPWNAWETMTYQQIADMSGVPYTSIAENLVIVVADTLGIPIAEVKERRNTVWQERTGRMTAENVARLRAYRSQDPPLSFEECAMRLGCSLYSVKYHSKKMEASTDE